MGNKTGSNLGQLVIVVLLLCSFLYRTESALPGHHEPLSITGRKMLVYNPNGGIETPSPKSKPGQKVFVGGTYYQPNGDIFTRPSSSGHGGGRIHQASSP